MQSCWFVSFKKEIRMGFPTLNMFSANFVTYVPQGTLILSLVVLWSGKQYDQTLPC